MLPRKPVTHVKLVDRGKAVSCIVSPASPALRRYAERVQQVIQRQTGVKLRIVGPADVAERRGLRYKDDAIKQSLILVGSPMNNPALLPPYLRRQITWMDGTADAKYSLLKGCHRWKPEDAYSVEVFSNAWGNGNGFVFLGSKNEAGLGRAVEAFDKVLPEHYKDGTLSLPRICTPGPDYLAAIARNLKKSIAPRLRTYLQYPSFHVGYWLQLQHYTFTLASDSGYFSEEELKDYENLLLKVFIEYQKRVWWWDYSAGTVGSRHPLFKNANTFFVVEHLLTHGRPNDAARKVLEGMLDKKRKYLEYVVNNAYHAGEDDESNQAWHSVIWWALANADMRYFSSGNAERAAMKQLMMSDNMTRLAANSPYGNVKNIDVLVSARLALSVAAWGERDGRWKWLLENMLWHKSKQMNDYFTPTPIKMPLDDIEGRRPDEWLGVQYLPLSVHDYKKVEGIPREETAWLITLRDNFKPDGQFLALDGFSAQGHDPVCPNSVLRYSDRGKSFLIGFTGKQTNYYHSGVSVARGVVKEKLNSSAAVELAVTLPRLGFLASRVPEYNGTEWTRHIFWKRGAYFLFLDELVATEADKFMINVNWRSDKPITGAAARKRSGWMQRQDDVSFFLVPAQAFTERCGREPGQDQIEIVPYMLRQKLLFDAQKGSRTTAANLLYASTPEDKQSYKAVKVSQDAVLVSGTRTRKGNEARELALAGLGGKDVAGAAVETDARAYYVSPEFCAIAGGTYLRLDGNEIIANAKRGNYEQGTPAAVRKKVEATLASLREAKKADTPSEPDPAEGEMLKPVWRFDDFTKVPVKLRPSSVSPSEEGNVWNCRFEQKAEIKEVVLIEGSRARVQAAKVSFSNDGFKKDIRWSSGKPKRISRLEGPSGKNYFRTVKMLAFAGQNAKEVRVEVAKKRGGRAIEGVTLFSGDGRTPEITSVKVFQFRPGQNVIVALTELNEAVALKPNGEMLWSYQLPEKVLTWKVMEWDGQKQLVVHDAQARMHFIDSEGQLTKSITLSAKHPEFNYDFFRKRGGGMQNCAYSMGLWREKDRKAPSLIMGTYQSVAWLRPDGETIAIDTRPEKPKYKLDSWGFMWRGLSYYKYCLDSGIDVNGDGTEDQVFLTRGWVASPLVLFFDGADRDAFLEYPQPVGQPLGLELTSLGDGEKGILAVTEFAATMYSGKGGKQQWQAKFDVPAKSYAVGRLNGEQVIVVGNREGMVLAFDISGKLKWRSLLALPANSVCTVGNKVLAGNENGIYCLDSKGNQIRFIRQGVTHLTALDEKTALAVTCPEVRLTALAP